MEFETANRLALSLPKEEAANYYRNVLTAIISKLNVNGLRRMVDLSETLLFPKYTDDMTGECWELEAFIASIKWAAVHYEN